MEDKIEFLDKKIDPNIFQNFKKIEQNINIFVMNPSNVPQF